MLKNLAQSLKDEDKELEFDAGEMETAQRLKWDEMVRTAAEEDESDGGVLNGMEESEMCTRQAREKHNLNR